MKFSILFQYGTDKYMLAPYSEEFTKILRAHRPRLNTSFDYDRGVWYIPDKELTVVHRLARKVYDVVDLTWSEIPQATAKSPFAPLIGALPKQGVEVVYRALARYYTNQGDDNSLQLLNEEYERGL